MTAQQARQLTMTGLYTTTQTVVIDRIIYLIKMKALDKESDVTIPTTLSVGKITQDIIDKLISDGYTIGSIYDSKNELIYINIKW